MTVRGRQRLQDTQHPASLRSHAATGQTAAQPPRGPPCGCWATWPGGLLPPRLPGECSQSLSGDTVTLLQSEPAIKEWLEGCPRSSLNGHPPVAPYPQGAAACLLLRLVLPCAAGQGRGRGWGGLGQRAWAGRGERGGAGCGRGARGSRRWGRAGGGARRGGRGGRSRATCPRSQQWERTGSSLGSFGWLLGLGLPSSDPEPPGRLAAEEAGG